MPYFINADQRRASCSTCYFEFQKGKFRNKHWQEDSLYIHADDFDELGLFRLFNRLPEFDCYGPNGVTAQQYRFLYDAAMNTGGPWAQVMEELDDWAKGQKVFSILGI